MESKLKRCWNPCEGLAGGQRKNGKTSGSFTGPLMELLTWVVELVLGGTLTGLEWTGPNRELGMCIGSRKDHRQCQSSCWLESWSWCLLLHLRAAERECRLGVDLVTDGADVIWTAKLILLILGLHYEACQVKNSHRVMLRAAGVCWSAEPIIRSGRSVKGQCWWQCCVKKNQNKM